MKPTTIFLLITLFTSVIGSCQTGTEPEEEIDADFVWRVCNQSETYMMEEIFAYGHGTVSGDSIIVADINPEKCSSYHAGFMDGNKPVMWLGFIQDDEEYLFSYLESYLAVRGKTDSTAISKTPGKYTYHAIYDPEGEPVWGAKKGPVWIEIEREEYH